MKRNAELFFPAEFADDFPVSLQVSAVSLGVRGSLNSITSAAAPPIAAVASVCRRGWVAYVCSRAAAGFVGFAWPQQVEVRPAAKPEGNVGSSGNSRQQQRHLVAGGLCSWLMASGLHAAVIHRRAS